MNYTWSVEKVRYEESTGRITHLHWKLLVTSGSNSLSRYGSVYLPDDMTIPFANVTQAILKNWLQTRLNATTTEAEIQTEAAAHLTRMMNPVYTVVDAPA